MQVVQNVHLLYLAHFIKTALRSDTILLAATKNNPNHILQDVILQDLTKESHFSNRRFPLLGIKINTKEPVLTGLAPQGRLGIYYDLTLKYFISLPKGELFVDETLKGGMSSLEKAESWNTLVWYRLVDYLDRHKLSDGWDLLTEGNFDLIDGTGPVKSMSEEALAWFEMSVKLQGLTPPYIVEDQALYNRLSMELRSTDEITYNIATIIPGA